ncbi:Cell division control protein 25 [Choanephora cucurbitarum]|uniref:Cell division control protein 25 n=1 Tax=Choanephora cucurbitarum TaxID=101091 RepID=A0A1C7NJ14_9FUNG|nr:Cell division control protein 25 [Choanephora cucurbitarum]
MALPQQTQYLNTAYTINSPSPPNSPVHPIPTSFTSHFVQALHDYLPTSADTNESVSCLFFKKGSIIEVFNRDDSGWWDGQCGDIRGWFPSNYVGRVGELKRQSADFDDEHSNRILELWHQKLNQHINNTSTVSLDEYSTKISAIQTRVEMAKTLMRDESHRSDSSSEPISAAAHEIHLLAEEVAKRITELVQVCNDPSQQPKIQVHIFRVVTSVKSILSKANIVNKESAVLKKYPELTKQRKIVLNGLSRLVIKGKELQQPEYSSKSNEEENGISHIADQLVSRMELLEKLLIVLLNNSSAGHNLYGSNKSISYHFDTPRSSVSSLGQSSIYSTNSLSKRQNSMDTRYSSYSTSSATFKELSAMDRDHILQDVIDHQSTIEDLINHLITILERYLINRYKATEILETTRKAVDAVRVFLAIIEHVYSILGNCDQTKSLQAIPEDPCLVALVIKKESVYSAITNLVTAVRASTGPQPIEGNSEESLKGNFDHLCSCCEGVIHTTNECATCVKTCLQSDKDIITQHSDLDAAQYNSNRGSIVESTLSSLERKSSILYAIQQQQDSQCTLLEDVHEKEIDSLSIGNTVPAIEANNRSTEDDKTKQFTFKEMMAQLPLSTNEVPEAAEMKISQHSENKRIRKKLPLVPATGDGTTNLENIKTETQTIEIRSQVPTLSINDSIQPKASVSAVLPPTIMQPEAPTPSRSTSKSLSTKSRRSRGLSMSSLRPSLHKNKSDRISRSVSTEGISETIRSQLLPSWISFGSSNQEKSDNGSNKNSNDAISPAESTPQIVEVEESEYVFLRQTNFDEDEMIFNADGEITGATTEALVRKLTSHEKSPDLLFTRAFLYNFRLFTHPVTLTELLVDRFNLSPPVDPKQLNEGELAAWTNQVLIPVRLRVYNVIKTWLESFFSYEQDACIEEPLMCFVSSTMLNAMPGPAKRMMECINKVFASKGLNCAGHKQSLTDNRMVAQKSSSSVVYTPNGSSPNSGSILTNFLFDDNYSDIPNEKMPATVLGKSIRNSLRKALNQDNISTIHVYDIDPVEMARQITLMESQLFIRIRPNEMIGQEFKKKVGISQAVHVKAMIQKSTQITSWISDTILAEADAKKRAQVLKYWIKVGDACLHLNNYNTLMAIRSALDSTSIVRLKKTWEYVSMKYRLMWEPIYKATDSQRNFAEYRHRLKTTVAPCLPFLGVYLTDMTFIDDGNSDRRLSPSGRSLVNFDKYMKITRVLSEIDQFQIPYRLLEVEEIQKYITKVLENVEQDDQVFYDRSLTREPKEEESL